MKFQLLGPFLMSFAFLLLIRLHAGLGGWDASRLLSLNRAVGVGDSDAVDLKSAGSCWLWLLHL